MTLGEFDFDFKSNSYSEEVLLASKSEDPFMKLGVEFHKSLSTIIIILGHSSTTYSKNDSILWNRDEAILKGLLLRCSKLQMGYLDNICQKRLEIANIIQRSLAETAINLKYLLKDTSKNRFNEYVEYSLRTEKKIYNKIEKAIADRGCELPIEKRILKSIDSTFEKSKISIDSVNEKNRKTWGGSIRNRFNIAGYDNNVYDVIIGEGSHFVHGNWEELLNYQLIYENGMFSPKEGWATPRPQPLFAIGVLLIDTTMEYVNQILPTCFDKIKIQNFLEELSYKIGDVDTIHEKWINSTCKH